MSGDNQNAQGATAPDAAPDAAESTPAAAPAAAAPAAQGNGTVQNPEALLNAYERTKAEAADLKKSNADFKKQAEDAEARSKAIMKAAGIDTGEEVTPELLAAKSKELETANARLGVLLEGAEAEVSSILEANEALKPLIRDDWPVEEKLRVLKAASAIQGQQIPAGSAPSNPPAATPAGSQFRVFGPGEIASLPPAEFAMVDKAMRLNKVETMPDGKIRVNMAGVN